MKNENLILIVAVVILALMFMNGMQTQAVTGEEVLESFTNTLMEILNTIVGDMTYLIIALLIIVGFVVFSKK